jgi:5-methylcytosine-specific restriction endonuclease McrA
MAFSNETVQQAWKRSGGKCECTRIMHPHQGRCNKELVWENRGREGGRGAWEAHHKVSVQSGGSDTLSNCEILCWDRHKRTI